MIINDDNGGCSIPQLACSPKIGGDMVHNDRCLNDDSEDLEDIIYLRQYLSSSHFGIRFDYLARHWQTMNRYQFS